MPKHIFIPLMLLLIVPILSHGQYVPLENLNYDRITQHYMEKNKSYIASIKPLLIQDFDSVAEIEDVLYKVPGNSSKKNTFWYRKIFSENLIRYRTKDFSITADPVFNFGIGYDFKASKNTWINTRGLSVTGLLAMVQG